MATFTDVYKQELKGKGVLSSLGSTMFKRSKERLDPRNILFGGSGITSAIGQKIFGKGYSALNKSSSGKSLGDSGMQSQALNALIISSKNQEAQLSIIAKNTMNSNAMARDMNVMRQNIMKLVTISGGKASRGSDMFFKDAAARESAYESQFGKSGGSKSVSPVAISAVPKKEDSGGLLSTLVKAVGAISVAILTLGTKLVTELGAVIRSALETLGNVLKGALLGKGLLGGGGGGPSGVIKPPSSNGKNLMMMGGAAGLLGLAYYFKDEIGAFINEQLKNAGVPNPSGSNVDPDAPRAGGIDIGNKVGYKAVEGGLAGYTAYRGAKAIAGMYKAPVPTAPSPMTKIPEGKPLTSFGSVGEKREMVKNKTMYEKVKAFFTKLSNNPKLMNVFKSKLLKRVGEAAMLRVVAIGTSIAAAPMTFGLSLIFAVGGAIWAINDLVEIYKLIFGEGGLYDEVMKEDVTESKSPTPVKSDEQVRLGMMADAAQASGNSSSSPSKANLLDIIAGGEAGKMGYDAANKGKAGDTPEGMPGLSNMKIGEVMQLQGERKLFAAGRYQIIPKTLAGLMSGAYGNTGLTLNDVFDKTTQDKLAQTLIDKRLKQGGTDPIKQQYALSQEFASIANPYTGKSYHVGVGDNKASITTEQIQTALSGGTLNQASTAIASAMRESSSQPPVIAFSAPQTINNGGSSAAPQTVAAATNIDALELFFQAAAGVRPI
jgi:hypothetical protein